MTACSRHGGALHAELVNINLSHPKRIRFGMRGALMKGANRGLGEDGSFLHNPHRAAPLADVGTPCMYVRGDLNGMSLVCDRRVPGDLGEFDFHGSSVSQRKELTVRQDSSDSTAGQFRRHSALRLCWQQAHYRVGETGGATNAGRCGFWTCSGDESAYQAQINPANATITTTAIPPEVSTEKSRSQSFQPRGRGVGGSGIGTGCGIGPVVLIGVSGLSVTAGGRSINLLRISSVFGESVRPNKEPCPSKWLSSIVEPGQLFMMTSGCFGSRIGASVYLQYGNRSMHQNPVGEFGRSTATRQAMLDCIERAKMPMGEPS